MFPKIESKIECDVIKFLETKKSYIDIYKKHKELSERQSKELAHKLYNKGFVSSERNKENVILYKAKTHSLELAKKYTKRDFWKIATFVIAVIAIIPSYYSIYSNEKVNVLEKKVVELKELHKSLVDSIYSTRN